MENPAPEGPWKRQGPKVPPGSTLDRGMCVEKRADDRPEEGGTLNSGDPEPLPVEIRLQGAPCDRPLGDAGGRFGESDPPIVVRDGRADHMAKGRAERQREQSTHHGKGILPRTVSRSLLAIGAEMVFNGRHRKLGCASLRGARCGSSARRDLRGGHRATGVPTSM